MAQSRNGTTNRRGTAPRKPVRTGKGDAVPAGEHWDPEEVGARIARHFRQEYHETEGPGVVGDHRIWRCWTHDGRYFHAHYGVRTPAGELQYFRDFQPFADWLKRMHAEETEEAASLRRQVSASGFAAEEKAKLDSHQRRIEWVRVAVAAIILLALLSLVVLQIGVRNAGGLNVSHIISVLLGAGVAYLLGYRLPGGRAERGAAAEGPAPAPPGPDA